MRLLSHSAAVIAVLLIMLMSAVSIQTSAQTTPPEAHGAEKAATLAKATAIRDAFVARIHADGFSCPIPVLTVMVEDVPSFGQYNEQTNIVRTSNWTLLQSEEKARFFRLAPPGASEADVRVMFEGITYGWIFVHELGHWWQACRSITASNSGPYQVEYGADRISLAYWREADPAVANPMISACRNALAHAPNPVPAGEEIEAYFNKHYEELGPTPAYGWFQCRMNITAYEEKPAPTFAQSLLSLPGK